jgi:hypothetical protein
MAFVHGKSAYFNLDTVGGTPTDLSAYCDNIDFSAAMEAAETTTFGNSAKTFIAGLNDATFSVSGNFDPALDAHMTGILAAHPASLTFVIGPQGSTGGQREIGGECLLTGYTVNPPVGDKVTFTADFQVTGAVTYGTF